MNKRGYAFAALLLTLCLLCGCSNVNLSSVTAFLTGEEQTESEPQPVEETPPEETEMAADTVLEEIQEFEVLRLAYQAEYGLNPYTTVSLCNRTILSLLYEPLYLVNSSFQPEPVLAAETELSEDGRTAPIPLRSRDKQPEACQDGDAQDDGQQPLAQFFHPVRLLNCSSSCSGCHH